MVVPLRDGGALGIVVVDTEADKRLAGVSLLVRGRHGLYVSALAALLSSRGARVWEGEAEGVPGRLPRGVEVVVLESPLPSELRETAAAGVPVIVLAERAEPADAFAAAQLGAHALLTKNCSLAELADCYKERLQRCAGGLCGTAHTPSEAGARTDR